ncbi:MAG TPA: TRAP transporter small permease [Paracoccus sp. (in: a-proteobacteria)]|uniref:TRAP transporter small permease n=1 Tax=Paracoccus sp. TaxID=267 RepID=UPI002C8661EF|nr:TRAP transporter small permease [Paracoccus sp. (in: a-proteobacteria)]HWL57609.1 TRAP transporter small permease [Paracoccus sp. (in: a-proteobacteria)]
MTALRNIYLGILRWIVILCMVGMLCLIFCNVVLRYAFNSGIYLSEGVSGLLYVWMTFIGALLVLYERGHVGVDMLVRRLPPAMRRMTFALTHVIMLYVTWLMLVGSWQQARINLHVISPATHLPIGAMYLAGVVFAVMSGIFLLSQLVLLLAGRLADDDLTVSAAEDEDEAERLMAQGALK